VLNDAFLSSSYFSKGFASGRRHDRVPWKLIKDQTANFINPKYLPEVEIDSVDGVALEDPSDMKKEQISRLLEHWRRPIPGSDLFRFSNVLLNSKTGEMMPASYADSLGPQSLLQNAGPTTLNEPASGAATWEEIYQNDKAALEDDGQFSPGPDGGDINMATDAPCSLDGRSGQTSPEPHPFDGLIDPTLMPAPKRSMAKLKAKPKQTASAKSGAKSATQVPSGPRPKPKPMNPNAKLVPHSSAAHQSATGRDDPSSADTQNLHIPQPQGSVPQSEQGNQVVSGRPQRQPVKRKLDPCLAHQFEDWQKKLDREQAKKDKARAERQAKRDAREAGPPAKRQRT